MSALHFDNAFHAYGRLPALNGFSLTVEAGEIVSLLGPSGSGKTTALRVAAGLEPLARGRVTIGEVLVNGDTVFVPPDKRDVGLVFQDLALFPHLTVGANVAFGVMGSASAKKARVEDMLRLTGLEGAARAYPHQLSGGQQQRVALARALAPRPRILLLDEPFSNLDVVLRADVRRETLKILKREGASALFVTHDPEEALFVSDRVAVMDGGRVLQAGTPEALYFQPATRAVALFFGEANVFACDVQGGNAVTVFGPVPAPGFSDGTTVDVIVRAAGIKLSTGGQAQAVVRSARMMGASVLVELEPLAKGSSSGPILARAGLHEKFAPGAQVSVGFDPRLTFVFAR